MKPLYTLEIYKDEKLGIIAHEKVEGIEPAEARIIISFLEEYKQKMLTYVLFNQVSTGGKREAVKAE